MDARLKKDMKGRRLFVRREENSGEVEVGSERVLRA